VLLIARWILHVSRTVTSSFPSILAGSADTTHNGHAYDIAKNLPLDYDGVVTVSGDGLIHEVMNGFSHHDEPRKAFAIPIAPIPTGSGNGLSLNLLGIEVYMVFDLNSIS
jgi:diacylglycerol kinase family enzyme